MKMGQKPNLNPLIPELLCTNIKASLAFYTGVLGFSILYQREENNFAMLERQGSQIMLDELAPGSPRSWLTAPLEAPFGRGMNLDIHTDKVEELYARVQERWGKNLFAARRKMVSRRHH
jgi:catechol 2,3-dioxygenase-like lactoylglutathione lyase family enzyme